jgi:DNA-binding NarL/FixJ family response regulator
MTGVACGPVMDFSSGRSDGTRDVERIRVLLAEDHHVVRAAIASLLGKEADLVVVGELAEASGLVEAVGALKPDVVVLDAHMPGHKVIEAARELHAQHPGVGVLILSAYNRREYVLGMLGAGACGYVLKDDPPEALPAAVRAARAGRQWLSPRVTELLVKSAAGDEGRLVEELTEREREVLRLMATGCRNERIADALDITEQTVKNHVRAIFGKLGVETRVEAVLYAISQGWVSPDAATSGGGSA